jgi:outer membrane beta-barrel protein
MDGRLQRLLLIAALTATAWTGSLAAEEGTTANDEWLEDIDLIPEVERREVKLNEIDNENFEIGAQVGLMSVEDFGVNRVVTASAAYHITEDFFVQATYGMTTVGETSFEVLSGGAQLLSDDERDMTFYDLSLGFNIFPGEAFLARRWAMNSGLYLIGGVGSTDFGGDNHFTVNAGLGYRLIARDWIALRLDIRDYMFEHEILGESKLTHNFLISSGLTLFF